MEESTSNLIPSIIVMGVSLTVSIFMLISLWRVFVKAGQPGWGILIPIYNTYLMLKIAGKPGWWLILFLIPVVNWVIGLIMLIGISQNFGKGLGYALGLIFLPFIFYPLLAFGDAEYQGAVASW